MSLTELLQPRNVLLSPIPQTHKRLRITLGPEPIHPRLGEVLVLVANLDRSIDEVDLLRFPRRFKHRANEIEECLRAPCSKIENPAADRLVDGEVKDFDHVFYGDEVALLLSVLDARAVTLEKSYPAGLENLIVGMKDDTRHAALCDARQSRRR